jgi:hypothetical protein
MLEIALARMLEIVLESGGLIKKHKFIKNIIKIKIKLIKEIKSTFIIKIDL